MKSVERIPVTLIRFAALAMGLSLLWTTALWSQTDAAPQSPVPPLAGADNSAAAAPQNSSDSGNDRMLVPPPVSGATYPMEPTAEARANYLRGAVTFTGAYTDNAVGAVQGHPISDVSYSVGPNLAIDESTPRLHWISTYAPGFTFYRRETNRNEADQNAGIQFEYRLSPHVTFSARDSFQKSSNVFNQPDLAASEAVSGNAQGANFALITPIADRLSNYGNVGLSYQFGRNGMIGGGGTFSNFHYPSPAQVPGLFDSESQGGFFFYSLRISKMHYLGASYQYQRLLSFPSEGTDETQTHGALLFYTVYVSQRFSISFFGGPQYSETVQPPLPPLQLQVPEARAWTPMAGASLGWQGRLNSLSISYSHSISGGGGLVGAFHMDSGSATVRQQITRSLGAALAGAYTQNNVIGSPALSTGSGHSVSGTASLQQSLGQQLNLQLGYSRVHQDYSQVAVIATTPDTNREFVALSYQFSRPLGR